jgi:hypothetical protein
VRDDFAEDFVASDHDPLSAAIAAWLEIRCGKLTSSNMRRARGFKKQTAKEIKEGAPLEPLQDRIDYMMELCAERMTDASVRHFVTDAMQWGLDHEDDARAWYEITTGEVVDHQPYVFYEHPTIQNCGASIDGKVGARGLVEIKCPATPTYVAWRKAGVVPEKHRDQIILELASTGRDWCDFVAYDPRVKIRRAQGMIVRYTPTAEEFAAVDKDARQFLDETDALFLAVTHG